MLSFKTEPGLTDFNGKTKKIPAIIRNNRMYLLENILPTGELIASLASLKCITEGQSHFIERQSSTRDKNAEILHLVRSLDDMQLSHFVRCLRQTNQKPVARILDNGEGLTSNVMPTLLTSEIYLTHNYYFR